MNANLYQLFHEAFQSNVAQIAFELLDGEQCSYGELDELSGKAATFLENNGVSAGDRVVAQVDKSISAVALYLGVMRIGAIYVPLNTGYTPAEVGFFLDDAEPALMVCRPGDAAAFSGHAVPHIYELGSASDDTLWQSIIALAPSPMVAMRGPEDLAAILYTSGTTGRSKGAMLSHRAMTSNAQSLHKIWGFEDQDILIHALPIFHVHGLFVALHTAFLNTSKIYFLPGFDADVVRDHLRKATILMGVPTYYSRLLQTRNFRSDDCAHMRLFISGSAPMTEQVHEQWYEKTGHRILERYGMTEAGMITSNPLDGERIPGTVGFGLPDVEVQVCDDQGLPLGSEEVGLIEIRGPNLFSGYWKLPEKTKEEVRDTGFFITGDLGVLSTDGRLQIVGRSKDMIISGGYNIYPKEIETVLDDVTGVRESAVIGVPHDDMGEGVVAILVAESEPISDAALNDALGASLARFKHPRQFYWKQALPRNTMGKVQKNELRDIYSATFSD